jgi:hypothetical protein
MKLRISTLAVVIGLLASSAYAQKVFTAKLVGVHETPIVVSTGTGHATVAISEDEKSIKYELTYSGLEGNTVPSGKVLFAHVHVGRPTVTGGVAVFFCGGGNTSVTQAACPVSGTVSGTWTSADVVGPTAQGIDPANQGADDAFARLVKSINEGLSYANVHTTRSQAGEIRGQLMRVRDDDDDDRGH